MYRSIYLSIAIIIGVVVIGGYNDYKQRILRENEARQNDELFALTWQKIPEEAQHLFPLVWAKKPQETARKLARRPIDRRAVIFNWGEVFRLTEHPGDRCILTNLRTDLTGAPRRHIRVEKVPYSVSEGTSIVLKSPHGLAVVQVSKDVSEGDTILAVENKQGGPIGIKATSGTQVLGPYQCPWIDEGTERAMDRQMKPWFSSLAETGADLDYVIMDYEEMFRHSNMDAQRLMAIRADPRSKAFEEKMSPYVLEDIPSDKHARARFNAITDSHIAEALNEAIFEVAQGYFPYVEMSNYSNNGIVEAEATLNRHGNFQYSPKVVGTHASHFMYGIVGNLRIKEIRGRRYGHGAFEALKLDVQTARTMRRSGNSIMPWIAPKSWHRDNITHYEQTAYYDELIFHLALTGADPFLFWNSKASDRDELTVDSLLSEVNRELRPGTHTLVTRDPFDWNAPVLATGAETERGYVYRITAAPHHQHVVALPRQDTIRIEAGVGTWYRTAFQPDSFSTPRSTRRKQ